MPDHLETPSALAQPVVDALDSADDVPPTFLCPISYKLMLDPIIMMQSGQSYDRDSMVEWLKRGASNDPVTGQELKTKAFTTNWSLRDVIRQWATDHGHSLPTPKSPNFYAQQGELLDSLDGKVAVLFDDGDFDKAVPLSQCLPRSIGTEGGSSDSTQSLSVGSFCWAPYQGRANVIYPGRILAVTPDSDPNAPQQTLAIAFDDGDRDDQVPLHEVYLDVFDPSNNQEGVGLEVGTRVFATYQGSSRVYPGIITTPLPPPPTDQLQDTDADREPQSDAHAIVNGPPGNPSPSQGETYVIVSYDDGDFDARVPLSTIHFVDSQPSTLGRRAQAPWHGSTRLWEGKVLTEAEAWRDVADKLNRAVEGLKAKSRSVLNYRSGSSSDAFLSEAYALAKKVQWLAPNPEAAADEQSLRWIEVVKRAPWATLVGTLGIGIGSIAWIMARKR